jgi:hypothetical protein
MKPIAYDDPEILLRDYRPDECDEDGEEGKTLVLILTGEFRERVMRLGEEMGTMMKSAYAVEERLSTPNRSTGRSTEEANYHC